MEPLVLGIGYDPRTSPDEPPKEPLHLDPKSSLVLSETQPPDQDSQDSAGLIMLLGQLS